MKIIKRSGTEEDFDISKIETAVLKANQSVIESERLSTEQVQTICEHIEEIGGNMGRALNVEEIQDLVENEIGAESKFHRQTDYDAVGM